MGLDPGNKEKEMKNGSNDERKQVLQWKNTDIEIKG